MLVWILASCAWGLLLRWSTGLSSYSGQGRPPMYGDYEAQRHWMEVTINLPVEDWYRQTPENDLQYWGLDYPPLTAYHSYACGLVAKHINPEFVALNKSRGFESKEHKFFMRASVLVGDILLFFPLLVWFFKMAMDQKKSRFYLGELTVNDAATAIGVAATYPGLILIDYGHFQYNSVSLGLALGGVAALGKGMESLGSLLFVMALNHKQMELYHALPFFWYLFGLCCFRRGGFKRLVKVGATVVVAFWVIWLPFLVQSHGALDVLHRLFPLYRGVFEDKVANFWCTLNNFVKIRNLYSQSEITLMCLLTTALLSLPSSLHLFRRPTLSNFLYSLLNVSLIFFLFSYQVHEKSVLLVALPALLLFPKHPRSIYWFLAVTTFSMTPLLLKDGLLVPIIALSIIFHVVATEVMQDTGKGKAKDKTSPFMKSVMKYSLRGCVALFALSVFGTPPDKYPDLYPVLVSAYSCAHLVPFSIFFHWKQFQAK